MPLRNIFDRDNIVNVHSTLTGGSF